MVDNIRRTGPIGVVKVPGPLSSRERRKRSRNSRQDHDEDERPTAHEESQTRPDACAPGGGGAGEKTGASRDPAQLPQTGRCIDVKV